MTISQHITDIIKHVTKQKQGEFIPLHEPNFVSNEWAYVKECIDTGWVSSVGSYVDRFEKDFAAFTGNKFAIACVNGTAALHISLLLAGVKSGDEVLCPALTFVASANAISYAGATPHFVDSEKQTLAICPEKLDAYLQQTTEIKHDGVCYNKQTQAPISAILIVHILGHVAQIEAINMVAKKYNISVVEDAAEALGSYRNNKHAGSFGNVAAFSFNGNKIITTGGGGMIVTDDENVAERAKHLTTTARHIDGFSFAHDEVGYNYRLPNINAALGCAQLEMLPKYIDIKRKLAKEYEIAFAECDNATFISEPAGCKSNYWLNGLLIDSDLDEILNATNDAKLMTRPLWDLMHTLPMYATCPRADLSTSEYLRKHIINIPSGTKILWEDNE